MLARLDTLRGVLERFAAREEKLNHDFRTRSTAELTAFESGNLALESRLLLRRTTAETALAEETSQCEARFQKNKAAINRAHINARKEADDRINQRENRLNEKIREDAALAERQRDQALADGVAATEAFQGRLAGAGEALNQLSQAARKAFRGSGKWRRLLKPDRAWPAPDLSRDENQLFSDFQQAEVKTRADLDLFGKFLAPRIFKILPLWLLSLLLLGGAAAGPVLQRFGHKLVPPFVSLACLGALLTIWIFYWFGTRAATTLAAEIAGNLSRARRLLDASLEKSRSQHEATRQRILEEFEAATRTRNQAWKQQTRELANLRAAGPQAVDAKARRLAQKNDDFRRAGLDLAKKRATDAVAQARQETAAQTQQWTETHQAKMAEMKQLHDTEWRALEAEWQQAIAPAHDTIRSACLAAAEQFPAWEASSWEHWTPPAEFKNAAPFARLEVALDAFAEKLPKDPRLALPGSRTFSVPLSLAYPSEGSILSETGAAGGNEAVAAINNILFRLLSTTPPGKLSLTIFDPVGLGENFAALMHLADYEESSINSRIWTQTAQFEEKLAELNEHMEKVIQMYLRNEYATIADYNAEAGTIAEKYHFLVIASFPAGFSDTAARRLRNIAASGARCGVFTLIQRDQRLPLPPDLVLDDLRKNSVCLVHSGNGFELAGRSAPGTRVVLNAPPSPEFATQFLHRAGQSSKNSSRVEVPFEQVAPADAKIWTEQTTEELRVPIGRSGATKLQYLAIGKGTRQHALVAGKTGSGKSTLFHVIITNLALWCSPEQVEFYLVDFKKGVEFKCYASRKLPHAKVVAIESDRAFGLSVLQRVDEELRRRGDLFRKLGAQDLAGYKRAGGTEPMPRSLLMIDEFQEFFTEEDRVSQGAAVLLDRIIRQGRAFGIHVVLGSQTLGGAYTLARATIGQMVIRIALQCNEADAYLIMDQDNPAPRLLSRPGEGIYNDTAGSIEGNSPFQAVWLGDTERDAQLVKVRERADRNGDQYPGPIVFEGNAPANVTDNLELRAALQTIPVAAPAQGRAWLGAPNSIKGPTEAVFQRQSGSNLLVVGQNEERAQCLLAVALISLAAQYPREQARFVVLDSTPPGLPQREFFQRIVHAVPHAATQINNNLPEIMAGLAEDLKRRAEAPGPAPETFILIHGLQNFKKLRPEDQFGFSRPEAGAAPAPAAVLLDLISTGPALGFHVLATCDTYNNVNRFLGRKVLTEFEMRVLFQMSASDSAGLIDAPDAATLGFHRAIFYQEREGHLEPFRPYAQPDADWIANVSRQLGRA